MRFVSDELGGLEGDRANADDAALGDQRDDTALDDRRPGGMRGIGRTEHAAVKSSDRDRAFLRPRASCFGGSISRDSELDDRCR